MNIDEQLTVARKYEPEISSLEEFREGIMGFVDSYNGETYPEIKMMSEVEIDYEYELVHWAVVGLNNNTGEHGVFSTAATFSLIHFGE